VDWRDRGAFVYSTVEPLKTGVALAMAIRHARNPLEALD